MHDVKILLVTHNIPTKLFTQWYATAVEVPETLEDVTQTQTSEEVITECLTLILKLGVYLTTLKVRVWQGAQSIVGFSWGYCKLGQLTQSPQKNLESSK